MKGEDTSFRDELRDIETGWIPWVLAAVYFPVYVLLDFAAGDLAATRLGLPQSVAVGLLSLTISGIVVLLFVLANLRKAIRRPTHSMGSSRGPLRRGVTRLVSPITGGLARLVSTLATAVLTVFVAARDGVAMLLAGIWTVVAGVGGIVFRVLALLARPFVLAAAVLARPPLAAASLIGSAVRRGPETQEDGLDEPVDRRGLEGVSASASPLRRSDAKSDGGVEPAPDDGAAGDRASDDEATSRQDADAETDDSERRVDADDSQPDGDADDNQPDGVDTGAVDSAVDTDEQVVPGDPSGESRADDGDDPSADRSDRSTDGAEDSVDQPDEEDWPEEWISASDV